MPLWDHSENSEHPRVACSEDAEHARVAERIRLDPLKIQEFGHTFIVGAKELLVDLRFYRGALDYFKTVAPKELSLKCQTKYPLYADIFGAFHDVGNDGVADALAPHLFKDGNGADFS